MTENAIIPVLIVGAGPAGLATAFALGRLGVPCRILEAAGSVGASFGKMRAALSLVSPNRFCHLPGLPFPRESPTYIRMADYQLYLERYARTFNLDVHLETTVVRVRHEAELYHLEDQKGVVYRSRALVAATGIYSNPHYPTGFDPRVCSVPIIHSVDYRDAEPYRGLSVLVVGAGLSAQEIALELEPVARVTLSLRRPAQFVPQSVLGVDITYLAYLPEKIPVRWLPALVPTREPFTGRKIQDALGSGRIQTRPGFETVRETTVEFAGGIRESYDRIILATGFHPSISWLGDLCRPNGLLLDRVKDCAAMDHPGLYYVGYPFVRTFGSRYIRGLRKDAVVVAHSITRYLRTTPDREPAPEDAPAIKLKQPQRGWLDRDGNFIRPTFAECARETLPNINVLHDIRRLPTLMMFTGFAALGPILTLTYFAFFLSWSSIAVYLLYSWIYIVWTNTIYWHRFACHRALRVRGRMLQRVFRVLSPVFVPVESYVLAHLVHHARPDQPQDPYTPLRGFWGCLFTEWTTGVLDADAMSDEDFRKVHRLLEHVGIPLNDLDGFRRTGTIQTWRSLFGDFALATALHCGWLYAAGGTGWILAMYAAFFVNHYFNLEFNYSAHGSGLPQHRAWDHHKGDLSINQRAPGFIGGEWHNNHHMFPRSMRSGFLPGQIDIPFLLVRLLKSCGCIDSYEDHRENFLARIARES